MFSGFLKGKWRIEFSIISMRKNIVYGKIH
jgi:hypothetical protein